MKRLFIAIASVLLCPALAAASARTSCVNSWETNTVASISTGSDGSVTLTLGDPDLCAALPDACDVLPCKASGGVGLSCDQVSAGSCIDYLVSTCTGQPSVARVILFDHAGACP